MSPSARVSCPPSGSGERRGHRSPRQARRRSAAGAGRSRSDRRARRAAGRRRRPDRCVDRLDRSAAVGHQHERPPAARVLNGPDRGDRGVAERRTSPPLDAVDGRERPLAIVRQGRDDRHVAADRDDHHLIAGPERRDERPRGPLHARQRVGRHAEAAVDAERDRDRKLAGGECRMVCATPSSVTSKSSAVSPATSCPRASVTVAYTSTRFTPDANCARARGAAAGVAAIGDAANSSAEIRKLTGRFAPRRSLAVVQFATS